MFETGLFLSVIACVLGVGVWTERRMNRRRRMWRALASRRGWSRSGADELRRADGGRLTVVEVEDGGMPGLEVARVSVSLATLRHSPIPERVANSVRALSRDLEARTEGGALVVVGPWEVFGTTAAELARTVRYVIHLARGIEKDRTVA